MAYEQRMLSKRLGTQDKKATRCGRTSLRRDIYVQPPSKDISASRISSNPTDYNLVRGAGGFMYAGDTGKVIKLTDGFV